MIKNKIFCWLAKRVGLKIYSIERTISEAEIKAINLNSGQYDRYEKMIKGKMRKELADKLPVMFIKSTNHWNLDIKLNAYIYASPIKEKFKDI